MSYFLHLFFTHYLCAQYFLNLLQSCAIQSVVSVGYLVLTLLVLNKWSYESALGMKLIRM